MHIYILCNQLYSINLYFLATYNVSVSSMESVSKEHIKINATHSLPPVSKDEIKISPAGNIAPVSKDHINIACGGRDKGSEQVHKEGIRKFNLFIYLFIYLFK